MAKLKLILEENGQAKAIALDPTGPITIGRTADNAVRISDALSSRHHCQISPDGDGFVVEDLKSRNGTKLNGAPLTARTALAPGDRIEVGDSVVHFAEKRSARPAAAPAADKPKPKRRGEGSAREAAPSSGAPAPGKGGAGPELAADAAVTLVVEAGPAAGQRVRVAKLPFVVGRKASAGLVLEDADVSGEHCMLVEDQGKLLLVDLGAKNGTFLDGERLRGRAPVRAGAAIGLGPTVLLRVAAGDAAEAQATGGAADAPPKPRRASGAQPRPSARGTGPGGDEPDGAAGPGKGEAVDEVASLDALGGDEDDAPPAKAPAKPAAKPAPRAAKATSARGKGEPAADAGAAALADEDLPELALEARLEAAGGVAAGDGAGRGGGVAVLVAGALAILGSIATLAVSLSTGRPAGDPSPPENRVANWSFEDASPDGRVPGWVIQADQASLVTQGVRHGRRALALRAAGDARPELAMAEAARVSAGKAYRVRAALRLEGQVAAALRVDWGADDDPGYARTSWAVVHEPANAGGWRDVSGLVIAPRGATPARVVAVVAPRPGGGGAAVVDRIALAEDPEPPATGEVDGPAGLVARVDPRGVLGLIRGGRELAADVGLALDPRDPLTHQGAARVDQPLAPQADDSLLALGALLDAAAGARVDYASSVRAEGGGLALRWTLGGGRTAPVPLVFLCPRLEDLAPLELDGREVGSVPADGLVVDAVREMAWGRGAAQVSFRLSSPARLELRRAGERGARLVFEVPPRPLARGEVSVGVDVGAASSGARDALRALFEDADRALAVGDGARALEALRRVTTRFAHDEAAVAEAKRRAAAVSARADRLAEVAGWARAEAEALPAPELAHAARSALEELERGFAGTPQLERARAEATRAEGAVASAARQAAALRVLAQLERAQRLREAGHVELARLLYQAIVADNDAQTDGVAEAQTRLAALPPRGAEGRPR